MQANGLWLLGTDIGESRLGLANGDRLAESSRAPKSDVNSHEQIRGRAWETDDVVGAIADGVGDRLRGRRFAEDEQRCRRRAASPCVAQARERGPTAGGVDENDVGIDIWEEREIGLVAACRDWRQLAISEKEPQRRKGFCVSEKHGAGRWVLHVQVVRDAVLHARREGHLKQECRQVEGTTPSMLAPPSGGRTVVLALTNVFARGGLER